MIIQGTAAAITAVFFWIISNGISKKVVKAFGAPLIALAVILLGIIPMSVSVVLTGMYSMPLYSTAMAAASGVFLGLGFILMYMSLRTEQLANASALGEIQPAALVLFGLLVLGEQVTRIQLLSMAAIFVGAFLIITYEKFRINKYLIPAALASVSWAVYWMMMSYAISSAHGFSLPVLVSRIVSIGLALAFVFFRKGTMKDMRGRLHAMRKSSAFGALAALVIFMGLVDGIGDSVFGITVISKVFAIGGAMTALSPMVVSFLGFLFYKERLSRLQFVGLGIMVAGAVVLGAV